MTNTPDSSDLLQIIAVLETQRSSLGDAVVDASIAALRKQLAELEASPPDEQRKLVTVLFADLAGFTALSERMDPEEMRELQDAYFAAIAKPIEDYGGSVEKYIGDAVLAVFGVPETHEDDAERAVHAALAMQGALDNLNRRRASVGEETSPLRLRIGIHTGLVVSRVDEDGDFVITGDTVNLASRLQSAAEPGMVLISADVYKLVCHVFETTDLGAIALKGRAEPVRGFSVAGPSPVPAKLRGIVGLDSPLVGRQAEMAALRAALERLERGVGGIVTVVGEAGIGKSRLVAELRKSQRSTDPRSPVTVTWIEGRCLSYGATAPFLLWLDLLRSTLRVTLEDSSDIVAERLRIWVQDLCPERFAALYPYLARLMSLPIDAVTLADIAELDGATLKQRIFRAAEIALSCTADRQPLVMVCEDLHWADPSSLELLQYLLPLVDHASLLLILVFRPHADYGSWTVREIAGRDYRHRYTDLWLHPLSAAHSESLVGNLLHGDALPESLRWRILSRAEGNPFFVEEVIRTLIDLQAIVRDETNDCWLPARDLAEIPIPDTLQGIITARIDRLQPDTRHVLQLASVIGRIFAHRVLKSIVEEDIDLDAVLLDLQRQELVRERARIPELEYIFKHELTREAAYNGILKRQRSVLHCQVAETLEHLFPDRVDEMASTLAHHWEEAEDSDRAVKYLLRAGDLARMAYAHQEVVDFYERALALLKQAGDNNRTARTLLKMGQVYHDAFDFERAQLTYQQAFALWEQQDRTVAPPAPHALRLLNDEPTTLDPALACIASDDVYMFALFRGLTRVDPDGEAVPAMARRWEILDNGWTYVFYLREDVCWSDGVPVTAHDFEFAWKRVLNPETKAPTARQLYVVAGAEEFHRGQSSDPNRVGVKAENDHTLIVQLATPVAYFLKLVRCHVTYPVPKHQVETWGTSWASPEHVVGNGPFQLESCRPGAKTVLVRHGRGCGPFWGNVERLELIHGIENWATAWQMYEENRIDVVGTSLSNAELFRIAAASHQGEYHETTGNATWFVAFDVNRPPLDDLRFRRALAHAIDKLQVVESIKDLHLPATGGFVSPGIPGHSPGIGLPYDPDLARKLLKEAGYSANEELPCLRLNVHHSLLALAASAIAQWRSVLGISCNVTLTPSHERPTRFGTSHAMVNGYIAEVLDPDDFLRMALPFFCTHWKEPVYDRLVERGRQISNHLQRLQLYEEADRLLMESAAIVPLTYGRNHWLAKPWIKFPNGAANAGGPIDIIIEPH